MLLPYLKGNPLFNPGNSGRGGLLSAPDLAERRGFGRTFLTSFGFDFPAVVPFPLRVAAAFDFAAGSGSTQRSGLLSASACAPHQSKATPSWRRSNLVELDLENSDDPLRVAAHD